MLDDLFCTLQDFEQVDIMTKALHELDVDFNSASFASFHLPWQEADFASLEDINWSAVGYQDNTRFVINGSASWAQGIYAALNAHVSSVDAMHMTKLLVSFANNALDSSGYVHARGTLRMQGKCHENMISHYEVENVLADDWHKDASVESSEMMRNMVGHDIHHAYLTTLIGKSTMFLPDDKEVIAAFDHAIDNGDYQADYYNYMGSKWTEIVKQSGLAIRTTEFGEVAVFRGSANGTIHSAPFLECERIVFMVRPIPAEFLPLV